jgi:hypothetical protein
LAAEVRVAEDEGGVSGLALMRDRAAVEAATVAWNIYAGSISKEAVVARLKELRLCVSEGPTSISGVEIMAMHAVELCEEAFRSGYRAGVVDSGTVLISPGTR